MVSGPGASVAMTPDAKFAPIAVSCDRLVSPNDLSPPCSKNIRCESAANLLKSPVPVSDTYGYRIQASCPPTARINSSTPVPFQGWREPAPAGKQAAGTLLRSSLPPQYRTGAHLVRAHACESLPPRASAAGGCGGDRRHRPGPPAVLCPTWINVTPMRTAIRLAQCRSTVSAAFPLMPVP